MIVVVILGVLAAIAIPVFNRYIKRGKVAEAHTMLQGIRMKQELYRQTYGCYVEIPAYEPTSVGKSRVLWSPQGANKALWDSLGVKPTTKQTYFQYRTYASGPGRPASAGDAAYDAAFGAGEAVGHWFIAQARGDLDGDGDMSFFEVTSQRETVFEDDAIE